MKKAFLFILLLPHVLVADVILTVEPYNFRQVADQEQLYKATRTITTEIILRDYGQEVALTDISDLISITIDPFYGIIRIDAKDEAHTDVPQFVARKFLAAFNDHVVDVIEQRLEEKIPMIEFLKEELDSFDYGSLEYIIIQLEMQTRLREARDTFLFDNYARQTSKEGALNYKWRLKESQPGEGDNSE